MDKFLAKLKGLSTNSTKKSLPSPPVEANGHASSNGSQPDSSTRQTLKPGKQYPDLKAIKALLARSPQWVQDNRYLALAIVAGGGLGAFLLAGYAIDRSLPEVAEIQTFVRRGTLTIKAADGAVIQQIGPATREKLTYDQIPPQLAEAFVASEDRRFYRHSGVDYWGVGRAVSSNLLARGVVEGGSTITQQLARIVFLSQDRTLMRKAKEALLAQKIEREMKKDKILEQYLNLVYLGSGAYGVADAAWIFFSKPVSQLTLAEMATIAGLPPAPSEYSPLVNPEAATERRDIVLGRMAEAGYITAAEAEQARSVPLQLKPSIPKNFYSSAPFFTSYIQKLLPQYVSKEDLELGGLTIETTVNSKLQAAANKTIKDIVENSGVYQGFSQASLVSIEPKTGEIRAMVGGTDFNKSQFNRATQAQRQPGSTFKAILYTAAIATGMSPWDGYQDAPFKVDGYQPQNYGRKYKGWMSLRDALTNSVNIISVKLILDVGFDPVIQLAKAMGIKSKLLPAYSLALGSSEVNLLEMTNAFGTLAAQGQFVEAHGIQRIVNRQGKTIYQSQFKPRQVIDQSTTAIMTWMMQNVVNSGTGQAAYIGRPAAGKTGTSEKARDLWFIGFIPQLVTGVWLGNDNNSPTGGTSSTAAVAWHDFMSVAIKGMPVEKFPNLPKLEGRKGSIKAKPVKKARVQKANPLPTDAGDEGDNSGDEGDNYRDSENSYRGGSSDYQGSSESESRYSEPAPRYESAPAAPVESSAPAAPVSTPAPAPAPANPEPALEPTAPVNVAPAPAEPPPSEQIPPPPVAPSVEPTPSPP
ncbi:MAG: transglycosylase domain-containing protein [Leptolyngbyaceae cyanobacterium]